MVIDNDPNWNVRSIFVFFFFRIISKNVQKKIMCRKKEREIPLFRTDLPMSGRGGSGRHVSSIS